MRGRQFWTAAGGDGRVGFEVGEDWNWIKEKIGYSNLQLCINIYQMISTCCFLFDWGVVYNLFFFGGDCLIC